MEAVGSTTGSDAHAAMASTSASSNGRMVTLSARSGATSRRLFQVLEKEYNKQKGLRQDTLSIQQDLLTIAVAMDDRLHALGRGERRTAVARLYSEEMLALAQDAQDCVDRIVHRLTCRLSRGGGTSPSALVRGVVHELRKLRSRSGFSDEIHKLKARLKQAHEPVVAIPNPIAITVCHESAAAAASSTSCRVVRNPVGIGKPMEELLSLQDEVEGEQEQLGVISVVGFVVGAPSVLAAGRKIDCAWSVRGRDNDCASVVRPLPAAALPTSSSVLLRCNRGTIWLMDRCIICQGVPVYCIPQCILELKNINKSVQGKTGQIRKEWM